MCWPVHPSFGTRACNPTRFAGTLVDLTDHKKAEDQMRKLAFFDPLTNLPNRRMMLDRLLQQPETVVTHASDMAH
jgi:GGDEF domain-containing protein